MPQASDPRSYAIALGLVSVVGVVLVVALVSGGGDSGPGAPPTAAPALPAAPGGAVPGVVAPVQAPAAPQESSGTLFDARRLLIEGRPEQAMAILQRLVTENPRNYEAAINYADALCMMNRPEEARVLLQGLRDEVPPNMRGGLVMTLARANKLLGNMTTALELMEEATRLRPEDAAVASNYGFALMDSGQAERAIPIFQKALLMPNAPRIDIYNNLANAYLQLGRTQEAESTLKIALEEYPGNPRALNFYGSLLGQMKRYLEAINVLQEAVQTGSAPPDALFNLALAYGHTEQYRDMAVTLEQFLALRPSHQQARSLLEEARQKVAPIDK